MWRSRSIPRNRGRQGAAVLCALLVVLTACGAPDTTQDTTGEPVVENTDPPLTEDTETEEADDSDNQAVAVELPGLPIGGNAIVVSDTLQCVDVGWTTPPDLPDWVAVRVTGVDLQPADGFALSDEPCEGDAPPCLEGEVRITTTERCYVAVTWVGPTLDSDRTLSFTSGEIVCEPDRVDACNAFRDEVAAAGPQPIGLEPAPSELEGDTTDNGSEG